MKTIILYASYHHHNTLKIIEAMNSILHADLVDMKTESTCSLDAYDLVGFASGIYYGKIAKPLSRFIESLATQPSKAAFGIITSGAKKDRYQTILDQPLLDKNFNFKGTFYTLGHDSFGPLRFIGGLNKNHPTSSDLENAKTFAATLNI